MAELAKKYRDRAGDRQDGACPDCQAGDPLSPASGCRAVAPDLKSGMASTERRRQMIQESKFLGGDRERIHLVKGLDYAWGPHILNLPPTFGRRKCVQNEVTASCNCRFWKTTIH